MERSRQRVMIRGSKEYQDWIDRFVAWQQRPLSLVVEIALRDLAARMKFEPPPAARKYGRAGAPGKNPDTGG